MQKGAFVIWIVALILLLAVAMAGDSEDEH